ncbi:MAG: SHOCT domain-containing protein [Myxococcales bacterium]|nr:SHOCT domain-containing protein [Myxococcales bacterium]
MKRKLLFKDAMLTDGICYFQDGKLNLIFGNIDYQSADPNAEYYRLDPRERTVINALRLQTNPARGYAAPPVVKGDKWLDTDRRNWLVIDPAVFFAKPAEEAKPETPVKEDPTLRLQKLKELLDQGLITPEEYEQKRQEILKEI